MRIHVFYFLAAVFLITQGCESQTDRQERLARTYCGSCHQFPEPGLLDKRTWSEQVLPQMAFRMGLDATLLSSVPEEDLPFVLPTLPEKPMVTEEEWESIRNYFLTQSPDSLAKPIQVKGDSIQQFDVIPVSLPQNEFPLIALIEVDTATKSIYTSNRRGMLHRFNYQFQLVDSLKLSSVASSILFPADGSAMITQLGIMDPNDQPKGSLLKIASDKTQTILVDSLKRPVFTESADFNADGKEDLVVCAFGNYTGELCTFENLGGKYKRHVLSKLPGARRVEVKDFNRDGLLDIIVLFTQGDEQITLLTNMGKFQFKVTTLLRFPPVYGSSYFETADFNGDGYYDLLYTAGDNADYSIILKPYHGIRVFLNDGKNQYKESTFFPMYGCSQAMARDFDQDGDLDIAAISFFPDFLKSPERSFVYLENKNDTFHPFVTSLAGRGRWLLMDVVDIDSDQDTDVLVAALNFNNGTPLDIITNWKSRPISVLLLKNKLIP